MSGYSYEAERYKVFTDEGQRTFLKVRDKAAKLLEEAGAVRSGKLLMISGANDTWELMACMDRLIELGEIKEITGPEVWGQDRIFVKGRN
jgi:hypothetical protein